MARVRGRRARRQARQEARGPARRRRLRKLLILGGIASAVGAFRNKKIEENRQQFNLP
jgi:hypothetical protein